MGVDWRFFGLEVFCSSIGAVSSPVNLLLLLLFHASHVVCVVLLCIPPYLFFFFRTTFRCFWVRDYAYDHDAYIVCLPVNTVVSFCHLQLPGAVSDQSWDPSQ